MIINNFLEVEPTEEKGYLDGDRSVILAKVFSEAESGGAFGDFDYIILESGSSVGLHTSDKAKMYIVLSGEGIAECDGDRREICAGDTIIAPAGSENGIFNTSVFDLRIISVTSGIK